MTCIRKPACKGSKFKIDLNAKKACLSVTIWLQVRPKHVSQLLSSYTKISHCVRRFEHRCNVTRNEFYNGSINMSSISCVIFPTERLRLLDTTKPRISFIVGRACVLRIFTTLTSYLLFVSLQIQKPFFRFRPSTVWVYVDRCVHLLFQTHRLYQAKKVAVVFQLHNLKTDLMCVIWIICAKQ